MSQQMLEKYRVLAQLGRGGMAEVYLAAAEGPSGYAKLLVIKVLDRTLAKQPEFVRMFADEAKLSARLNHPNVVQTFEVGESAGHHFIAMEYLEGQPLHRVIERLAPSGGLTTAVALRIVIDALAGLDYAHEVRDFDGRPLDVVHRDVTPQNLFVTYEGQVKILDFGIAKALDSRSETTIGTVKGKVSYMAPEHARGEALDRRADVFSMGVVLWELLAGRRLWEGLTDVAVIGRLLQGAIPPLGEVRPDLTPGLVASLTRALAPRREDRPASAAAFQRELEVHLDELTARMSQRRLGELMRETFQEERMQVKAVLRKQLERAARTTPTGETPAYGLVLPQAGPGAVPILGEGADVHDAVTALHTGLTGQSPTTLALGSGTGSYQLYSGQPSTRSGFTSAEASTPSRRSDRWFLAVAGLGVIAASIGGAAFIVRGQESRVAAATTDSGDKPITRPTTQDQETTNCDSPRKPVVELTGEIASDATLTCDKEYLLRFTTTVLPGTTLKIRPGTVIQGDLSTKGRLVVQPGARIDAVGTADRPIVFTSAAPAGQKKAGDWGGVILLGQAPTNLRDAYGKPTVGRVEGLTAGGEYGGNLPNDSSGRLRYIRIEYSGTEIAPNNEINGLTLAGVGRGTEIDFVQVRHPADDCFEFFGGTVDAKHLVCDQVDDDGFDWDYGYSGRLQFLVSRASSASNDGSNGFEGDNDPNGSTNEPISNPLVYNATLIGKGRLLEGKEHYGVLVRRGTQGRLRNLLVTGFSAGVDLRDSNTRLNIAGSVFWNNLVDNLALPESSSAKKSEKLFFDDDAGFDEAGYLRNEGLRIGQTDPSFVVSGEEIPKPRSALLEFGALPPDDGFFDKKADFVGAFRDASDRWDLGWAVYE